MMEIWNESFWKYVDQNYTRYIRSLRTMLKSIYEDKKHLTPDEIDKEFMRTIFYGILTGYIIGSFAAYIKLDKYDYKLPSWTDYRPEQWDYLERFIRDNGESLFFGMPAVKKARAMNDIMSFMPNAAMLDAMLWYAQNFTGEMSEKLHQAVENRTLNGQNEFFNLAYMIASSEFVRAVQWGIIKSSIRIKDVVGFLFVAIIDEKTSRFCRPRHLMYIPIEDKEKIIRNCPPLHPHCRSVLEPVTQKIGFEKNDLTMPQPPYYSPNAYIIELLGSKGVE